MALDGNAGAVHHIAVPNGAGELGGEATLLLGQTGRSSHLRQTVLLQQTVHAGARQALLGRHSSGYHQALNLVDGATRVLPLCRQYGLLHCGRYLGLATVYPDLGHQRVNAALAPSVVPSLNGFFTQHTTPGIGDGVLTLGEFSDAFLQFPTVELLRAHQCPQHGQPKQGYGINFFHRVTSSC